MYDPRYVRAVAEWNAGRYFDASQLLTDYWLSTEHDAEVEGREFYQGLLQAAVAVADLEEGRLVGARTAYLTARRHLDAYRPAHAGLDLEAFLAGLDRVFRTLAEASREEVGRLDAYHVDPSVIPLIGLDPAPTPEEAAAAAAIEFDEPEGVGE